MSERYDTEDWLRRQYHGRGLSCTEIAKKCDVSRSQVHRRLQKHGIETRSQGTSDFGSRKYHDLDWLREKFHDEGLSYTEIGDLCGVSKQTIYNSAKKVGLDTSGDTRYRDREWFYGRYIEDDWTQQQIADECGVSEPHIIKWRRKHDIQTQYPTGENHPHTKPNEECVTRDRGQDWHRQRSLALERADYACENPDCSEDAESLGQNPDVHHIVPYRFHEEYNGINDLSNLLVLCRSCHNEAEPPQWIKEIAPEEDTFVGFSSTKRAGV